MVDADVEPLYARLRTTDPIATLYSDSDTEYSVEKTSYPATKRLSFLGVDR